MSRKSCDQTGKRLLAQYFRGSEAPGGRGGGGGLIYEIDGMLVVSLKGENFGFWSRLG